MPRSLFLKFTCVALWLNTTISIANALSSPQVPEVSNRHQFIQLINPVNLGMQQSLPVSFVRDWPTWVLDEVGSLSKIPDSQGFVQPTSVDEIWHPVDLKRPALKLAIGLHIRDGTIRHVMPAVDLSYDGGAHRNRGMCSVPRAHTWIDFTLSLDEWENYNVFLWSKDQKDDEKWKRLQISSRGEISRAIERAIMLLSGEAPDEIGSGSHILHVVLKNDNNENAPPLECPRHAVRATMYDQEEQQSVAVSEGCAVLDVVISSIMAGSESEFLPDAYQQLFTDSSLRNPRYERYKQRQRERQENK